MKDVVHLKLSLEDVFLTKEVAEWYNNGMTSDNQNINRHPSDDKPWLFKPGQSGNPAGRPPGKSLKEYSRSYLAGMTEKEREDFLSGLPKEVVWKMAEGNPDTKDTHKHEFAENLVSLIKHGTSQQTGDTSIPKEDSE